LAQTAEPQDHPEEGGRYPGPPKQSVFTPKFDVPARAGLERQRRDWATKFEMRTPRYKTRVEKLPVARA
jgi:hypothetical protein